MSIDALKENLKQTKEIVRELYVFTRQLNSINNLEYKGSISIDEKEKKLLNQVTIALTRQLIILNNSIPSLLENIRLFKKIGLEKTNEIKTSEKLVKVKYEDGKERENIFLTIDDKDKKEFLSNLSKSHLSINHLKKKYAVEKPISTFGKTSYYSKISSRFFRKISNNLIERGYFSRLNRNLRKINSPYILGSYVSMILLSFFLGLFAGIFLFIFLLFFNVSITLPFIGLMEKPLYLRLFKTIWIIPGLPFITGFLMYIYPYTEAKNIGLKINQELPFITIHMSAIATSGLEPLGIFKILLKSKEYKYSSIEFRKILNLVNFHGKDLVTALKNTARVCPSSKLRELLNGISTSINSGGNLHQFLDEHSESLLFDYKLERERYTKVSETFMDIYISIVIAAPMILLMLFVIMGSTGMLTNFLGLSIGLLSLLIIFAIILLNIGFLIFLRLKQPVI